MICIYITISIQEAGSSEWTTILLDFTGIKYDWDTSTISPAEYALKFEITDSYDSITQTINVKIIQNNADDSPTLQLLEYNVIFTFIALFTLFSLNKKIKQSYH